MAIANSTLANMKVIMLLLDCKDNCVYMCHMDVFHVLDVTTLRDIFKLLDLLLFNLFYCFRLFKFSYNLRVRYKIVTMLVPNYLVLLALCSYVTYTSDRFIVVIR